MTMEQIRFNLLRRRAAQMVRSLLTEGYTLVSQSNACESCILRHRENGNWMKVTVGELGVYMYKNQQLVNIELL